MAAFSVTRTTHMVRAGATCRLCFPGLLSPGSSASRGAHGAVSRCSHPCTTSSETNPHRSKRS